MLFKLDSDEEEYVGTFLTVQAPGGRRGCGTGTLAWKRLVGSPTGRQVRSENDEARIAPGWARREPGHFLLFKVG